MILCLSTLPYKKVLYYFEIVSIIIFFIHFLLVCFLITLSSLHEYKEPLKGLNLVARAHVSIEYYNILLILQNCLVSISVL
jgi:hypothetical protein